MINKDNTINFDGPAEETLRQGQGEATTPWARPMEFDGEGMKIQFLDWSVLKEGEGKPPVKYVNDKGYTYRLTFSEGEGPDRFFDNQYDTFMFDIKKAGTIKSGSWRILKRWKDGDRWTWSFTPLSVSETPTYDIPFGDTQEGSPATPAESDGDGSF